MDPRQAPLAGSGGTVVRELEREPARAAARALPEVPPARGLLDTVVEATNPAATPVSNRLQEFLGEPSPWKALVLWVGSAGLRAAETRDQLARLLSRDVARLDALLSA